MAAVLKVGLVEALQEYRKKLNQKGPDIYFKISSSISMSKGFTNQKS